MTIENKDVADGDNGLKDKDLEPAGESVVVEDKKDDDEDKKLSEIINPLLEGDEEEAVTMKRGALKKLNSSKENYKTVAIAAKKNPRVETVVPPAKKEDEKTEFVTIASQQKKYEKEAITRATVADTAKDPEETQALKKEINDNWDDIKAFYTGKSGKDDPQNIYEDILDAHAAWKRRHGSQKDSGTETAAALAASRGNGGTPPKPAEGQRKHVLPRSVSPRTSWYPKKD